MSELKFIFTGPPGVGKSTAIRAVSEIEPIDTDVLATDELAEVKERTTAAMDFGEFRLDDGTVIRLYGTPGQERFNFMWDILADGALGLIILVDNSSNDPFADLQTYMDGFADIIDKTGVVIGITRSEHENTPDMGRYYDYLMQRGKAFPLFPVDIRDKSDVTLLLDAVMATAQYNA